ncbi:hypothetical protein E2C01_054363 [Portunus trituberculatus]|uniref:Uncharacterized protein n=1 Tax=Portunus trituberculatus TaxID=210409 RepID=A0A5B7GNA1_PORTR|nr:hypothetical protein [Portunus trituberculatus]
MLSGPSGR